MDISKYYKCQRKLNCLDIFKPISKTHDSGFYGYELKITPGKDLFFFSKTIIFDWKEFEEITESEYIELSKKYIEELNIHFPNNR